MAKAVNASPDGTMDLRAQGDELVVELAGRLEAASVEDLWKQLDQRVRRTTASRIVVKADAVEYCDGAGLAFIVHARNTALLRHLDFRIDGLERKFQNLLAPFEKPEPVGPPEPRKRRRNRVEELGRLGYAMFLDLREMIAFVGEVSAKLPGSLLRPRGLRWGETFLIFDRSGVNAIAIVGLIGFLMGLIMGFQSAIPLQTFGVDIYVVNLVALAMLRELGPIMTAIVVAGRSGSAFAAELGTMKVNEELDALKTMSLDPVRFLVMPRLVAGMVAMPVLTIYANLVGILGGMFVVVAIGHPWAAAVNQLINAVGINDVAVGMVKSVFFGYIVAAIGCLRGLQTARGALGVGQSTTRSVVSSIFLIILTDALFSIVFYALGL